MDAIDCPPLLASKVAPYQTFLAPLQHTNGLDSSRVVVHAHYPGSSYCNVGSGCLLMHMVSSYVQRDCVVEWIYQSIGRRVRPSVLCEVYFELCSTRLASDRGFPLWEQLSVSAPASSHPDILDPSEGFNSRQFGCLDIEQIQAYQERVAL